MVLALREAGHDVVWVGETMVGAPDEAIVARAHDDDRILLTADKDFGEIGSRVGRPLPGIILLRFPAGTWGTANEGLLRLLRLAETDLRGQVAVLTPGRARFRRLREPD